MLNPKPIQLEFEPINHVNNNGMIGRTVEYEVQAGRYSTDTFKGVVRDKIIVDSYTRYIIEREDGTLDNDVVPSYIRKIVRQDFERPGD